MNKIGPQLHSIIPSCDIPMAQTCFEHPSFFNANAYGPTDNLANSLRSTKRQGWAMTLSWWTSHPLPKSCQTRFSCNISNMPYCRWNSWLPFSGFLWNNLSLFLWNDLKQSFIGLGKSKKSFHHYFSGPGICHLHTCCLPWMWEPLIRLLLLTQTLIPHHS